MKRKHLQIKVKKLALAYGTGWEYTPESEEAGSVLTDIFLDMAEGNRERYGKIWEKHELAFQEIVPRRNRNAGRSLGELAVSVPDEGHGKWLKEGTTAYAAGEEGMQVRFRTVHSLQLTSARLQCAVYCRGLNAWLSYEAGKGPGPIPLFQPVGLNLAHPVFRWYFPGLCDGMEYFRFTVEFHKATLPATTFSGKWTVSDGKNVFSADWRQTESGILLEGRAPQFAENLEGESYEIRLEPAPGEDLGEWAEVLGGGFALRRAEEEREPELCMTDFGVGEGSRVLPFGDSPEEASCCYLACDRIMAGEWNEMELRFRESYLTQERLPAARTAEEEKRYQKWYQKYPWLQQTNEALDWQAEDTLWEYFNGNMWRDLPGSETWRTGCCAEAAGTKVCRWKRPRNMEPCTVEGEKHFYIRLRLRRVKNAQAQYYRKIIPVLEEIRFYTGERRMVPDGEALPDLREAKTEKMCLGFDRDVTPDNCWYTGEGACFFGAESIRGREIRFGREAFWVELTQKKERDITCLRPNYVSVRKIAEEQADSGSVRIRAGDPVYLDSPDMGMLEAVCLSDIRCGTEGFSALSERSAAEHYFAHFDRLLTPMDMELMLRERYPGIEVSSCTFSQEDKVLEIELACLKHSENGTEPGLTGYSRDEICGILPEIVSWLEEVLPAEGPVWLQECSVNCRLKNREETKNAGADVAGRQQLC